jgi:hypothetical protein
MRIQFDVSSLNHCVIKFVRFYVGNGAAPGSKLGTRVVPCEVTAAKPEFDPTIVSYSGNVRSNASSLLLLENKNIFFYS